VDDNTLQLSKKWTHFDSAAFVGDEVVIEVNGVASMGEELIIEDGPNWHGWVRNEYLKSIKCPKGNVLSGDQK
jgi:hypothetical protein